MRGGRLGLGGELFGDESKEKGEQLYARLRLIFELGGRVYYVLGAALRGKLLLEDFRDNPFVAVERYRDGDLSEKYM